MQNSPYLDKAPRSEQDASYDAWLEALKAWEKADALRLQGAARLELLERACNEAKAKAHALAKAWLKASGVIEK
jgi:hypothetical protein